MRHSVIPDIETLRVIPDGDIRVRMRRGGNFTVIF